jgi:hypothetical protein
MGFLYTKKKIKLYKLQCKIFRILGYMLICGVYLFIYSYDMK